MMKDFYECLQANTTAAIILADKPTLDYQFSKWMFHCIVTSEVLYDVFLYVELAFIQMT